MTEQELIVGAHVKHSLYGEGYVITETMVSCDIIFERGGKRSFTKRSVLEDLELIELSTVVDEKPRLSLNEVEDVLRQVLEDSNGIHENVPIGERWENGTLILKPNNDTQPKEIPLDTFFHKIVMVRDRLRVLEQNINSHKILTDADKYDLQQYITRIYGSLTSFNVLFKEKDDYFVGMSGEK
jgi:hypothetical protein